MMTLKAAETWWSTSEKLRCVTHNLGQSARLGRLPPSNEIWIHECAARLASCHFSYCMMVSTSSWRNLGAVSCEKEGWWEIPLLVREPWHLQRIVPVGSIIYQLWSEAPHCIFKQLWLLGIKNYTIYAIRLANKAQQFSIKTHGYWKADVEIRKLIKAVFYWLYIYSYSTTLEKL